MSPEYAMDGIFSVKSDVFSFGVLVLEIVSGRKNRGVYQSSHHLNLLAHVSATSFTLYFHFNAYIILNLNYEIDFRYGVFGMKVKGWN